MPDQIGIKRIGTTALKELVSSATGLCWTSVVIEGNANATYGMGAALKNGDNGFKVPYPNDAVVVTAEAVGTGDGVTTTFDLDNDNVIAGTLKGYVDGVLASATLSRGTGVGGADRIVFAVAPANEKAATADYKYATATVDIVGACILGEDVTTTVGGGNVSTFGLIKGNVKTSMVKDSGGELVDKYFKAVLPMVRFE